METTGVKISSVNIDDRKKIGIRPGDTVRVWQKVEEKGKTRLQSFEGIVLARKHGTESGGTFTVRRVNDPYGVEKIFPLYSPVIDKIEIVKRAKVRSSKLYHIRKKAAREIKRQMRNLRFVSLSTVSDIEEKAKKDQADIKAEQEAKSVNEEKASVETDDVKNLDSEMDVVEVEEETKKE